MRIHFTIIILFSFFKFSYGQTPVIQWQRSFGGSAWEGANSIQQTMEGGYIIGGSSGIAGGNVTFNHGGSDVWIVKLDVSGNLKWQKSYGSSGNDRAIDLRQTSDGGFIVACTTDSANGNVSKIYGQRDYWIIKLDTIGNIQWEKSYGGAGLDDVSAIRQTKDKGYIIVGGTNSQDYDVTGTHGGTTDYWILKIDSLGKIQWQKTYGGTNSDEAFSVEQTSDGGYIVVGTARSFNGDITSNKGHYDYWVVKLNSAGSIQWQKSLGGTNAEWARSVKECSDGGYIVAGYSNSTDGDITYSLGAMDYWIVKLNSTGQIKWQKSLGGSAYDYAYSVVETEDRGFLIAGESGSSDGDVTDHHYYNDFWLVKLDSAGNLKYTKSLGGSYGETANSILEAKDGGIVIAGYSGSSDGDLTINYGSADVWVVKLDKATVTIQKSEKKNFSVFPNPAKDKIFVQIEEEMINVYYVVINQLGKELMQGKFKAETSEIDISDLPSGLYFLHSGKKKCILMKY